MTDEKQIERLTELARKAWPHVRDQLVIETVDGGAMVTCTSTTSSFDGRPGQDVTSYHVRIPGPRGLDALEAAMLVLAGEVTCVVEAGHLRGLEERAESAEMELAKMRGVCRSLAVSWAMQADASHRHDVGAYCRGHSDELFAALDGEPLLVGTNPDEVVGRMQAQLRASETEAKLAALQASIGALAAKWRAGIDDNWEDYPVVEDALDELIEAAKAGR